MKKLFGLAALILVIGAGCSNTASVEDSTNLNDQNIAPQESNTPNNGTVVSPINNVSTSPTTSTNSENAEVSFTLDAKNFSFAPNRLEVKKGQRVSITIANGEGFHDLVIDEFNVRAPQIQTGQTATITFVADKAGEFEYYCSVGQHRQMGMKGTLVVTD
ncbi:MAG: cupredoxin domain-containing protein [Candidatus Magasanikbacteria bacterium]